jgi:transposase-like protein
MTHNTGIETMSSAKTDSDEFKADAVNLIKEMSISQAAKKLGVATSSLHGWYIKSLGQKTTKGTSKEELSYDDILKKLKNTEKELRYANEINKVLKKSLGIMVQEHPDTLKK